MLSTIENGIAISITYAYLRTRTIDELIMYFDDMIKNEDDPIVKIVYKASKDEIVASKENYSFIDTESLIEKAIGAYRYIK